MPLDDLATLAGWRARLALDFERRGERTVLARRAHDGPLVVQKALHPEGARVCHAIVVHPAAGIVGGDDLRIEVSVGTAAHALVTTPGATKWYGASRRDARQRIVLDVGEGACVEWLPQETIVYDGARADQAWEARLAAGATLVAWDIQCLGRTGSGERFTRGVNRLESRILREGRLAWLERGRIDEGATVLAAAAGLASHPVFGTFVLAATEVPDDWLAAARDIAPPEGEGAVTRLPGSLLARYRGADTEAAREYFTALWRALRERATGCAPREPRIWRT